MNITPSRRPHASIGIRGQVVGSGILLAAIVTAAAAPAALASPSAPGRSASVQVAAGGKSTLIKGPISWSVAPASATAPQTTRNLFSYTDIKPGSAISDHVAVINRSAGSVA